MSASSDRDFAGLYDEHLDFVWRNLRALGVPVADVEDAAQDTFVVAYRRREDFRTGASMRAWLYGIARRVAYRQRRGGGRRARLADAFAIEPRESSSLEGLAQTQQAWALAMAALDGLPPAQREAYWLTEFEGLTAAQAGAALGVSGNTISSRLRSARQALARHGEVLRAREDGELQRCVAQVGRPSAAQRRTAVAALAGRLAVLSKAAAPGLGGLALWGTIAAAGLVTLGVGVALNSGADTPSVPLRSAVAATERPPEPRPTRPAPKHPAAAPAETAPVVSAQAPAAPAALPADARREASTPAPATASTLAAEAKLVRAIKAAVSTDPQAALELAERHAARFPRGLLSAEASSLRAGALCRLGRETEAKLAAQSLPSTHPSAAVARLGCPQEKTTNSAASGELGDI